MPQQQSRSTFEHCEIFREPVTASNSCNMGLLILTADTLDPARQTALVLHEGSAFHQRDAERERERAGKWKAKCHKLREDVAGLQAAAAAAESAWKVLAHLP